MSDAHVSVPTPGDFKVGESVIYERERGLFRAQVVGLTRARVLIEFYDWSKQRQSRSSVRPYMLRHVDPSPDVPDIRLGS